MKDEESTAPQARTEGLIVREAEGEVLVYDPERHRAICLNQTAALVWRGCDGRTTVAGLARLLHDELDAPLAESAVWLALDRLGREHLLRERVRRPPGRAAISRRDLVRRIGVAAALPLITSILAPTAKAAASCLQSGMACTSPVECCSQLCPGAPNGACA
ncbi:MAG TPA: PqqD family protein [Pyrinomonadaceae bacterium]